MLLVLTAIRLLIPFSIFKWPLIGILSSISADLHDWQFFPFQKAEDYIFYQYWDKSLDFYYLFFMAIVVLMWKDKIAKQIAISLFTLRTIGVFLFFITGLRKFLFFNPLHFLS